MSQKVSTGTKDTPIMPPIVNKFCNLPYFVHLLVSLVIRLLLIVYGAYHDRSGEVQYTDIDYGVFTDAARYIVQGESPYSRHTYRYSPLLALVLVPNIVFHPLFGKVLFSIFDLVDAILIRSIITKCSLHYRRSRVRKKSKPKRIDYTGEGHNDLDVANVGMICWLYNPLTLAISTRGSCDSLAVCLVLATLYLLQCRESAFIAGLVHGLAIHFRLYPIVYSLTYFMYLSDYSFYFSTNQLIEKTRTVFKLQHLKYVVPNSDQVRLVTGTLVSLVTLTSVCYALYGYDFVYETYIYHLVRKDFRHNFSLYFYLQYLTAWIKNIGLWQKVLTVLPQLVLLVTLSVRYGLNKYALNFAVLCQTIVVVTYNGVITSQYFVWALALLPLSLWQLSRFTRGGALLLVGIWFAAQGAWLLPAYFLEFHCQNTFFLIWIQGVSFFCANIAILGRMIMHFGPGKETNKEH